MQGWSPFRLSKGPLFSCQSSGKEAKMVPFSANKWSPFRLTNTYEGKSIYSPQPELLPRSESSYGPCQNGR